MSIWLEIMCDVRNEGANLDDFNRCWTHRNDNVMGMSEKASTVTWTLRLLAKEALKQGWVRRKGGTWVCPYCKENAK